MKMKAYAVLLACALLGTMLTGCAGSDASSDTEETVQEEEEEEEEESDDAAADSAQEDSLESSAEEAETSEETAEEETDAEDTQEEAAAEVPEGMYLSELTGLPIDENLLMQRPIAVMVDNEKTALEHYGIAEADIVYEMVNSTANNRITRLMCVYKDWDDIEMIGSIRSVRPTNILIAQEYEAVICHDGGPFYVDDYFSRYSIHFSGGFSRVDNGKATEFTEYVVDGDLESKFASASFSSEYEEEPESHFNFVEYGTTADLSEWSDTVFTALSVDLPFYHNSSRLVYNEETETYDYYEYGSIHRDAEDDEVLTFDNVLLQSCDITVYDDNGYLIYNCIAEYKEAYYLTKGEGIAILWSKTSESGVTHWYDATGNEIEINTGKTYIAIVPEDTWDEVVFNQ